MSLNNIEFNVSALVEITDSMRDLARLAICAQSTDATEAEGFMRMMGIHPSKEDV
jgi:hypothetical protein